MSQRIQLVVAKAGRVSVHACLCACMLLVYLRAATYACHHKPAYIRPRYISAHACVNSDFTELERYLTHEHTLYPCTYTPPPTQHTHIRSIEILQNSLLMCTRVASRTGLCIFFRTIIKSPPPSPYTHVHAHTCHRIILVALEVFK
jgi:hypothetical protein